MLPFDLYKKYLYSFIVKNYSNLVCNGVKEQYKKIFILNLACFPNKFSASDINGRNNNAYLRILLQPLQHDL